ncbi:MAG: response regulator transcription factor [Desulfobacterales bacterium]|nr:response regulator transcription factor [Desulfobacterales bacterium]
MRILVIDDDEKLCQVVKRGLEEQLYAVDCVYNGDDGQYYAENTPYDLIILDVMMPQKNGLEVCRNLISKKINTPIIMLTAKDTIGDRVKGLDTGADDYLVKPFAFPELLARTRALLRRKGESKSSEIKLGDLVINTLTHEVFWKEHPIDLTSKEYVILEYLMRNPNAVLTRTMIENHAWDYELDSSSNLVDVYIKRIRQKIDTDQSKSIIQTIRGAGYRIGIRN